MVAVSIHSRASPTQGISAPADRITVSSQGVLMKSYGCCLLSSGAPGVPARPSPIDRKSTRLNSSHQIISYAVFCLKKKNTDNRSRAHEKLPRCDEVRA